LTLHPEKEGSNVLEFKDSRGLELFREMVEKKSGVVRYDWLQAGESRPREKIAAFEHYPGWDWVVAATVHLSEFTDEADDIAGDILLMATAIILAALGSGFLVTRYWVSRPLQQVVQEADKIAAGDLSSRPVADGGDEVGNLKRAMATMAENLKRTITEVRQAAASVLTQATTLVGSAQHVSQSSQVQRDAATGMAASVEEMSVSIEQVAQHTRVMRSACLPIPARRPAKAPRSSSRRPAR